MITRITKLESIKFGSRSIQFIQKLKKHVQIGNNEFTRARAAYGLKLIDEYLNGRFLEEIQEFTVEDIKS
jgi:hypothetical protein